MMYRSPNASLSVGAGNREEQREEIIVPGERGNVNCTVYHKIHPNAGRGLEKNTHRQKYKKQHHTSPFWSENPR